jgi:two-component system chemotaxis response regulator CheY
MKVLVVDDSRAMRSMLRMFVQEVGFEVVEAADGALAMEAMRAHAPDIGLCLVDWNMPNVDGLAFVKMLRRERAFADVKVMMVSAESDMGKVARALMVGADEYAIKPMTREAFHEKLQLLGLVA